MTSVVTFNESDLDDCYQNYYESNLLTTYLFYFLSLSLIMMSYIVTHYMELYRKLYIEVRASRKSIEQIYEYMNRDSSDDESSSSDDDSSDEDIINENMSDKMDSILKFMANEIERSKKNQ